MKIILGQNKIFRSLLKKDKKNIKDNYQDAAFLMLRLLIYQKFQEILSMLL